MSSHVNSAEINRCICSKCLLLSLHFKLKRGLKIREIILFAAEKYFLLQWPLSTWIIKKNKISVSERKWRC